MGFSAVDYVVLLVYLVGITIFGTLFRPSHRSVKDYFVGTKTTHWLVISLSIVATETSTLTLIGVPALAYSTYARPEQGGSLTYLQVVVGYVIARVIISVLFIPAYFQGELLTAYELLSRRFGAATKHFAASLFLTMRALAEGRACVRRVAGAGGGDRRQPAQACPTSGSGRSSWWGCSR